MDEKEKEEKNEKKVPLWAKVATVGIGAWAIYHLGKRQGERVAKLQESGALREMRSLLREERSYNDLLRQSLRKNN